jgi:serine/threonine protein kinase
MLTEMLVLCCRHPNLPFLVGMLRPASENPGLVWELVDGWDLTGLFQRKHQEAKGTWRPATATCLEWCSQLFSALACLHANDMVHRDVKPSNVMVTRDLSTIKLVDFGLCKTINRDAAISSGSCRRMSGMDLFTLAVCLSCHCLLHLHRMSGTCCTWYNEQMQGHVADIFVYGRQDGFLPLHGARGAARKRIRHMRRHLQCWYVLLVHRIWTSAFSQPGWTSSSRALRANPPAPYDLRQGV